jgi:hypothetical protein
MTRSAGTVCSATPGVRAARTRTPVTWPSVTESPAVTSPATSVPSLTVTLGSRATRDLISRSSAGLLSAMPSRPDDAGFSR